MNETGKKLSPGSMKFVHGILNKTFKFGIKWGFIKNNPMDGVERIKSEKKNNDIPDIRFHDLRHLQATLLIHAGTNPAVVSKRLGHSSISITLDTYTHSIDEFDRQSANNFENIIKDIRAN